MQRILPKTITASIIRPSDATQYGANEVWAATTPAVGGSLFSEMAPALGGCGIITDAIFASSIGPGTLLQGVLYLFDAPVTAVADNAALVLSDAEIATLVATIDFTLIASGANNSAKHVQGLNIGYQTVLTPHLYGLVKVVNTYTPASGETLTMRLKTQQYSG